jgi:predicted lipoprotein with Yx(FWY)xxD motif
MRSRPGVPTLLLVAVALVTACASPGGAPAGTSPAAAATSPAATSPAAASPSPAGATTVEARQVGNLGTVLVAGSNGMTVYIFTQDQANSGTSACTGNCITNWPALTVPAGQTPTGGPGVTGQLATITRPDDGTLQVTYNGRPLYFFVGDRQPGDGNGVYENWEAVKP